MEGNHRQNQKQNFVLLYAHISIHVMRDDVTVLNFDVKEFNFDVHNSPLHFCFRILFSSIPL